MTLKEKSEIVSGGVYTLNRHWTLERVVRCNHPYNPNIIGQIELWVLRYPQLNLYEWADTRSFWTWEDNPPEGWKEFLNNIDYGYEMDLKFPPELLRAAERRRKNNWLEDRGCLVVG